jgi:transcription elongation GreA/GreB family factor
VLPRVVLRVRKAVRQLARREETADLSGAQNEASWQNMLDRVEQRDREIEARLARAERALNRLTLS